MSASPSDSPTDSPSDRPVPPVGGPRPATTGVMSSLRMVITGMAGGIVFLAVALAFILPVTSAPPLVAVVILLAVGVVSHLAIERAGYRAAPLPTGLSPADARAQAAATFQSLLMIRAILAEATALVGVVLAFVLTPRSWLTYLLGAVIALVLVARHAWPSPRTVDRVAQRLEAQGTGSGLREVLGLPPADRTRAPGFQEF